MSSIISTDDRVQPTRADWTLEDLERDDDAIREVAVGEFGLDVYPNQIEVITSEQMLDAYASSGIPIIYPHWTFGKEFARNEGAYRRGMQGLAYEIVINSDPCIAYLMEENSRTMQRLVIAHASYGHNSFFKGNELFRQWTQADGILDFLVFARHYIMECEERYGFQAVEETLDSLHALQTYGIDRYKRPTARTEKERKERERERRRYNELSYNDLMERTQPHLEGKEERKEQASEIFPPEPQENFLYFIEKYSPKLKPWQRELARIVRKIAQYFYPQAQTKVMNEGWATFWHYTIMNRLHEKGYVEDGDMVEFLRSHTNVTLQPSFDSKMYSGINPYALGFAMFSDIRRICERPDDEDREWFPDIAGSDWRETLDFAMRNFRDESFILQFLSPRLMRKMRLFALADHESEKTLVVDSIHNEQGFRRVRRLLSEQHNRSNTAPDVQIVRYDRDGSRELTLRHTVYRGRPLSKASDHSIAHFARLWGFPVHLETVDEKGERLGDIKHFKPTKFSNE